MAIAVVKQSQHLIHQATPGSLPTGHRSTRSEVMPGMPEGGEFQVLELITITRAFLTARLTAVFGEEKGQTMAEYAVVLAVITLLVLGALTALSGGISNALNNVKKILP